MDLIGRSHQRSRELFAQSAARPSEVPKTFEAVAVIDRVLQLYEGLRLEMVMVRATLDEVIDGLTEAGLVAKSRHCEMCGQRFMPARYGKRIFESKYCEACQRKRNIARSNSSPNRSLSQKRYEQTRLAKQRLERAARKMLKEGTE